LSEDADGLEVRSLAATFRANAEIHEHLHGWGQLVYVASGAMRVAAGGGLWLTPPTRALWVPAGVAHRLRAVGTEVALRTLYIAQTRAAALPATPTVVEVVPLLRELVLHILSIGMLARSDAAHERLAGLLVDLIGGARQTDLRLPMPSDPRALRLVERLLAQPGERADLAVLATAVGASLRTLQRIFPRETGLSIEAWRQKANLVHSVARLAEGATVTEAGLDSGWESTAAFISAFRQAFGVTPGCYPRC
jgi:AraC-like DNA-binding protein